MVVANANKDTINAMNLRWVAVTDTNECEPCLHNFTLWKYCHKALKRKELIRRKREDCAQKSFNLENLGTCIRSLCMQAAMPTEPTPLLNPTEEGECIAVGQKYSQDISVVECMLIENRKIVSNFESSCKTYNDWKMQLCYRLKSVYAMNKYCGTNYECRRKMKNELSKCQPNDRECMDNALSPHQRLWIFVLVFSIVFVVVISVGVVLLTLRSRANKVKQMKTENAVAANQPQVRPGAPSAGPVGAP